MGSVIRIFDKKKAPSRRPERARVTSEIRFRYPADDAVAEVSCFSSPRQAVPKRPPVSRRAS